MSTPLFPISPLERVREGMLVVDGHGRRLGTVVEMRLGYPQAVYAGTDPADTWVVRAVVAPLGSSGTSGFGIATPFLTGQDEAELPEELQLELQRAGYVKVDGPDLRGAARYIHGDQIADVSGDTVYLRAAP